MIGTPVSGLLLMEKAQHVSISVWEDGLRFRYNDLKWVLLKAYIFGFLCSYLVITS